MAVVNRSSSAHFFKKYIFHVCRAIVSKFHVNHLQVGGKAFWLLDWISGFHDGTGWML